MTSSIYSFGTCLKRKLIKELFNERVAKVRNRMENRDTVRGEYAVVYQCPHKMLVMCRFDTPCRECAIFQEEMHG